MASFTAGTTFTDGVANDVTAAKLGALVTNATPTSGFIQDRTTETVVGVNDTILIGDASDSNNLKKMTVANLLKAPLVSTSGTVDNLTTGTTTSTAQIVTSGTFLGTITGSTNVINIGGGQIYKDGSGKVLIGTTSNDTGGRLEVKQGSSETGIGIQSSGTDDSKLYFRTASGTYGGDILFNGSYVKVSSGTTERLRIDSSGNVGIGGVTSPISSIHAKQATPVSKITLEDLSTNRVGQIGGGSDGDGGFLSFSIGNNGGSITEAMRIDSSGNVLVGKTSTDMTVAGSYSQQSGRGRFTTNSGLDVLTLNRQDSDGIIVEIRQANTVEGSITVSGNTVSYNPFAGSHWSQLEDGSKSEILRGTVIESVNQLCQWPDGGNERFAKCKISDTVASNKVYGVFIDWDNDWTQTNDLYVTAVGLFVCRINASVTVQIGDLLESNGDGTARVQADNVIRSSTIGKVTSSIKTHEHPDGSYCVPTVLYCG